MDSPDILYNIMLHTDLTSTLKLMSTCKLCYKVGNNEYVWSNTNMDELWKQICLINCGVTYFMEELQYKVEINCNIDNIKLFNKIAKFFKKSSICDCYFKYINVMTRSKISFYQFINALDNWKYGCVNVDNNNFCKRRTTSGKFYCERCDHDQKDIIFLYKHEIFGDIVSTGDDTFRDLKYNYTMVLSDDFENYHLYGKIVDGKEIKITDNDKKDIQRIFGCQYALF